MDASGVRPVRPGQARAGALSPARVDAAVCAGLVLAALLLWLPRLSGPLDLRFDAGVYYVLGTSLAEGKGYRLLNEPGEIEAVQYPPLLPLLVAAHQKLLGTSDPIRVGGALRIFYLLLFSIYIPAVYLLARRWLGPAWAASVALLCATNVLTIYMSDTLFAELPFAVVAVLFVLAATEERRGTVLQGALGVTAYLLRTLGVALLAAWVGESVLKGRWKQAAARAAIACVPVLLWQLHVARVAASPELARQAYPYQRADYQYYNVTYQQNLKLVDSFAPERGLLSPGAAVRRFFDHLVSMPVELGESVSAERRIWEPPLAKLGGTAGLASLAPGLATAGLLLLGGLSLAGLVILALRKEWRVPLFAAGTVALMCLTPWPAQFTRYLMPLTPFLLTGVALALQAARGRFFRAAAGLIVTGLAVVQAFALLKLYTRWHQPVSHQGAPPFRMFFYDDSWREFDAALDRLAAERAPGIVASTAPHWIYLRTGRKAVLPPLEADPAAAQRLLDEVPAAWLVLDDLGYLDVSARYAEPVVRSFPERWEPVASSPQGRTRIYRRAPEAQRRAATPRASASPP